MSIFSLRASEPNQSHPGIAILWASGLFVLALALSHISGIVLSIVANVVYTVWYRHVPFARLLAYVRVPIIFAVFAASSLPLEIMWEMNAPELHFAGNEGFRPAAVVLLRSCAAIFTLAALFLTERVEGILSTCARLGVPSAVVEIALLVYSSIHDLAVAATKMQHSANARLGLSGGRNRVRTVGLMASGLWLQALAMARAKQFGISTRNLDSGALVSSLALPKFRAFEALCALGVVAAIWIASHFLEGIFL